MNEILFFTQLLLITAFALWALKFGKEILITWVTIQALIANFFVLKQITLFGLNATPSDSFAVGSILGLNFLQEYFGKKDAEKAIWICFFTLVFFTLASQLHLLYQPNSNDITQSAYLTILSASPRLLMASMGAFFVTQRFDIGFFAFLKKYFPRVNFSVRTAMTLIFSQFLDTLLFTFMALYGIVASPWDIIIISFLVKLVIIFCFTFFISIRRPVQRFT